MIFRHMCESDLDRVSQLERENFSEPWSREAFAKEVDSTGSIYAVAVIDGQIMGVSGVIFCGDYGEIMNVSVHESARRKNIGFELLSYLMGEAEALGYTDFTLEVRAGNQPAIALYEKLGFRSAGVRPGMYSHPLEDGVIYWKRKHLPL